MSLEVVIVLIMGLLFMFFVYMRYKTNVTIFNLFAIGCIVAIGLLFTDYLAIIIVFVGLILWLIYDTFLGGF